VHLEPLGLEHAANMCRWMSDPEVAANVGLRQKASVEKTVAWIEKAMHDSSLRGFAIMRSGEHVGNVVLDQIDGYLNSARLSVYIGERHLRGQGIGSTAVYLAVKSGFEQEKLNKVWLTVHVMNHAAISAYVRLGFVLEGILRDEFWLDGKRTAVLRMSLLQKEFAGIPGRRG
jgi:RimJ/RimL family protein N-acetyltransferase